MAAPEDVVRTPGTESNVKEIYDRCKELELDPRAVVFNQFSEFGNHLVHELVTGRALARVVDHLRVSRPGLRVAAFVSATGSAGTIAAGDHLKERDGAQIVAVEALECPTLTENGFGEHNIQGIGDKHVPLIHNVMNTDTVVAISDRATDQLNVLFNTRVGRDYLAGRRGVPLDVVQALDSFGLSSICNVLAAVRYARSAGLGPDDLIVTVATDGAGMYDRARQGRATRFWRLLRRHGGGRSLRGAGARRRGRPGAATDRPGPAADLQPWVLHVGGAAGDRTRRVRRTSVAGVLDGPARAGPGAGRADRGLQCAGGGRVSTFTRVPLPAGEVAARSRRSRPGSSVTDAATWRRAWRRSPSAVRPPYPGTTLITCCDASSTRTASVSRGRPPGSR